MADVSEDGSHPVGEKRSARDVSKGYTYFERDDILVAKITPCMENGKATHLTDLTTECGFGSTEFHVLRAGEMVDSRYLFFMVWNPLFRFTAERNMTGTAGQKRVSTGFIERYEIPLPPSPNSAASRPSWTRRMPSGASGSRPSN